MKKLLLAALVLLLLLPLWSKQGKFYTFLPADISVNDNITAVDGTAFDSRKIFIADKPAQGTLMVQFTPAAAAAVPIDFEFGASIDDGATWSTAYYVRIRVNTDEQDLATGTVVVTKEVDFFGIYAIKLNRVIVGNGAGNCTGINAKIAF